MHRLAHEKRGSIYARREELAAWWERGCESDAGICEMASNRLLVALPQRRRGTEINLFCSVSLCLCGP